MSNRNGVHHVINITFVDGSYYSYCGKRLWKYDQPITLDHAKLCLEQGAYLTPCKRCMKIANKLKENWAYCCEE